MTVRHGEERSNKNKCHIPRERMATKRVKVAEDSRSDERSRRFKLLINQKSEKINRKPRFSMNRFPDDFVLRASRISAENSRFIVQYCVQQNCDDQSTTRNYPFDPSLMNRLKRCLFFFFNQTTSATVYNRTDIFRRRGPKNV